jgi:hypothetical protein
MITGMATGARNSIHLKEPEERLLREIPETLVWKSLLMTETQIQ